MKKKVIKILLFVLMFLGMYKCHRYVFFNKTNHINTFSLGEGIFEEKFQPFSGGVLMSDTYSYYLTDSVSFRILLGQCDEKELYRCIATGDSIIAIKYSRRIYYGKEIAVDSIFFSINTLKKQQKFE
ncbi:hypothetical protein GVN22_01590 [Cellulophaga sp. BC115SP]|nr:hypothetical protein [Cellulophaga sp. BC115SP]